MTVGYYSDPFIQHFIHAPSRCPPLINRGYYSRVAAIHRVALSFLSLSLPSSPPHRQIISLGAGSDTLYFRLKSAALHPTLFVDVDFPSAIDRRRAIIDRTPALRSLARTEGRDVGEGVVRYDDLALVGADLRDLPTLEERLQRAGVAWDVPTLLLSECVLVYLPPTSSTAVIAWAGSRFSGGAVFLAYEQLHPETAFGRQMVKNLEARGCGLLSLPAYPDVEAQRVRYVEEGGWDVYAGWDMLEVHGGYLDEEEVRRVERVEGLDELEEWNLIQSHYHISMAATRRKRERRGEAPDEEDERLIRVGLLGAKRPEKVKSKGSVGEYGRAGPLGLKEGRKRVEGMTGSARYAPLVTASPAAAPSDGSA